MSVRAEKLRKRFKNKIHACIADSLPSRRNKSRSRRFRRVFRVSRRKALQCRKCRRRFRHLLPPLRLLPWRVRHIRSQPRVPQWIPPQRSRISPLLGLHMSRMRHREHTKRSARPRYVRRQARPCRIPQRKYAGRALSAH